MKDECGSATSPKRKEKHFWGEIDDETFCHLTHPVFIA